MVLVRPFRQILPFVVKLVESGFGAAGAQFESRSRQFEFLTEALRGAHPVTALRSVRALSLTSVCSYGE